MNNKVTALIITGTPDQISKLVNNSFSNLVNTEIHLEPPLAQPTVKYKYYRPTVNNSYAYLQHKYVKKIIDTFLKSNISFQFKDLLQFIDESSKIFYTPSNAALSNYLIEKKYARFQIVLDDSSQYYQWEKI